MHVERGPQTHLSYLGCASSRVHLNIITTIIRFVATGMRPCLACRSARFLRGASRQVGPNYLAESADEEAAECMRGMVNGIGRRSVGGLVIVWRMDFGLVFFRSIFGMHFNGSGR